MYFITTKRMLEVCFSAHPNIQYRTFKKRHRVTPWIGMLIQGLLYTPFTAGDSY